MKRWLTSWLVVMLIFAVIDAAWIAGVVLPMYRAELGTAMSQSLDPVAALAFYMIFTAGITAYGVAPGSKRRLRDHAQRGALYGFFTYATYALTLKVILATSWTLALSDIAWGVFVSSLTSAVAALILTILRTEAE